MLDFANRLSHCENKETTHSVKYRNSDGMSLDHPFKVDPDVGTRTNLGSEVLLNFFISP